MYELLGWETILWSGCSGWAHSSFPQLWFFPLVNKIVGFIFNLHSRWIVWFCFQVILLPVLQRLRVQKRLGSGRGLWETQQRNCSRSESVFLFNPSAWRLLRSSSSPPHTALFYLTFFFFLYALCIPSELIYFQVVQFCFQLVFILSNVCLGLV